MQIIHIASEIAPLAKVGGLADVLLGLSRQQKMKGHESLVLLPNYSCIHRDKLSPLHQKTPFGIWWGGTFWGGEAENYALCDDVQICLLQSDHPNKYFRRESVYGFSDDIERFVHFGRAALDYLVFQGIRPDVLHLHDWQASICAWLARSYPFEEHFRNTRIVLTIHNLEYQGHSPRHVLELAGVDTTHVAQKGLLTPHEQYPNLLRGAILSADHVVPVSPSYAREICSPEGGKGLDKELASRGDRVCGILNGLDYTYWNPETDPLLIADYSLKNEDLLFEARLQNKKGIRDRLGLEHTDQPLVVCITRLVPQKGIELIKHALHEAFRLKYQMILIGSTHEEGTRKEFTALQEYYSQDPHVRIVLLHDEQLAHLAFAASDITLVPSLFEPCGLTQLIALRYGSIPLVRKTGGLQDTVKDISSDPIHGNGFVFEHATKDGITWALERAVHIWYDSRPLWNSLVLQAMRLNFSWERPEEFYDAVYRS